MFGEQSSDLSCLVGCSCGKWKIRCICPTLSKWLIENINKISKYIICIKLMRVYGDTTWTLSTAVSASVRSSNLLLSNESLRTVWATLTSLFIPQFYRCTEHRWGRGGWDWWRDAGWVCIDVWGHWCRWHGWRCGSWRGCRGREWHGGRYAC